MKPLIVRNLKIGSGLPKICISNTGTTKEEILELTRNFLKLPMDLMEWRADWFAGVEDEGQVMEVLQALRGILADVPLLFTFRTKWEGGVNSEILEGHYSELNRWAVNSGCVDLVDVELFMGDIFIADMICMIHDAGVKVVVSNHEFKKTPAKEELIFRLRKMQDLGADITKIAVMPKEPQDVLCLLAATSEMHFRYATCPMITMSMAGMGSISRLSGEIFGSAVTFGAGDHSSAPGQIPAKELKRMMEQLHRINT